MLLFAGELLVGPAKTLFLDEISTGLDSNTTFQIMRSLRHFAHIQQATMLIALLQPTPETYHLFDDIMLLSEGVCQSFLISHSGKLSALDFGSLCSGCMHCVTQQLTSWTVPVYTVIAGLLLCYFDKDGVP